MEPLFYPLPIVSGSCFNVAAQTLFLCPDHRHSSHHIHHPLSKHLSPDGRKKKGSKKKKGAGRRRGSASGSAATIEEDEEEDDNEEESYSQQEGEGRPTTPTPDTDTDTKTGEVQVQSMRQHISTMLWSACQYIATLA